MLPVLSRAFPTGTARHSSSSTNSISGHAWSLPSQPGHPGPRPTYRPQRRCSRGPLKWSPGYEERLRELADRRTQYDFIRTFKIDDVNVDIWIKLVGENPARLTRNTSHPINICANNPRCEIGEKKFSNRVVQNWNALPNEVKNSFSVSSFKRSVVNILLYK